MDSPFQILVSRFRKALYHKQKTVDRTDDRRFVGQGRIQILSSVLISVLIPRPILFNPWNRYVNQNQKTGYQQDYDAAYHQKSPEGHRYPLLTIIGQFRLLIVNGQGIA